MLWRDGLKLDGVALFNNVPNPFVCSDVLTFDVKMRQKATEELCKIGFQLSAVMSNLRSNRS